MKKLHFAIAFCAFTSFSLILSPSSYSLEYAGLTDNLGNVSTRVLSKLGYDCKTSNVGIVCQKCQVEANKQKCVAYLCDVLTKKCRKKSAELPRLPNFGRDN
ncbi:MAG: hypothetical protein ACFCAD_05230 [Pleurocapsa sp.]